MTVPHCSVIVVNFNGRKHLDACLRTFEELDYPQDKVELILVDNGSDDGSELDAQRSHPRVRLLRNPENSFAAALNLGVRHSRGDYVVFANNDVFVDRTWLKELVRALEENPQAGAAGGKLLFTNGRINSVGHRALPDFYWEDEGYDQPDRGQYETGCEVEGLCWAAVLFRRACLEDIGPIDEDYVLYYEDVDTSLRCRQRGWKSLYVPPAVARHVFHGSSHGTRLAQYFCDRNRLLYAAKHHPRNLAAVTATSRFIPRQEFDALYESLLLAIKKLIEHHRSQVVERVLEELKSTLVPIYGNLGVDHLMARLQVILGHRKMSIGFYDQGLAAIGGGQKYGCTMAATLQDRFEVTLVTNKPVTQTDLEKWYRLRLTNCRLRVVPLPFFDGLESWVDSNLVTPEMPNPFEAVACTSEAFDVFVNVNQLTMVEPRSPFSLFLCHFPDTDRRCYFSVEDYSCLVTNSQFTAEWIRNRWDVEPSFVLYPPVEMPAVHAEKENIILSVARFEPGGSKKQHELIRAFEQLRASQPDLLRDWRLVLVGGSLPHNPYLEEVQRLARKSPAPVEVRVNVPHTELQEWYAKAKIFWHACGLGETNPHLIEHFGMTTVEAMQNRCVPIVIDGGGQREIVEPGLSGFRFSSLEELCHYTAQVLTDPGLFAKLQEGAYQRSQTFHRRRFQEFVEKFFAALEREYRTLPRPDPRKILRNERRTSLFQSVLARRLQPPVPALVA